MATAPTRKAPAADSRTRGFTLLELLIALAIAALLFVFVVPAGSRQRDHAELANAARAIAAGLRMTRLQAINAGRSAVFAVDVDNAVYQSSGAAREALPRGTRLALVTQRRETGGSALGDIRFFPDGSSTGGAVTVSRGSDQFEVLVNWLTGGVSVHEQRSAP